MTDQVKSAVNDLHQVIRTARRLTENVSQAVQNDIDEYHEQEVHQLRGELKNMLQNLSEAESSAKMLEISIDGEIIEDIEEREEAMQHD